MKKPFLITIHSIAGLFAGIFILLLSISGTVLIFKDDLDDFQKPSAQWEDKAVLPVDRCYAILKTTWPNAEISNCLLPQKNNLFSFFVYDTAFNSGKSVQEIFIHSYTGKILGTRGGSDDVRHNFMSWLSKFHNSFHAGKTGEWMLGVFAIVFVLSLISGIIIYSKSVVAVLSFKRSVYTKNNLHQLIGVYALLFNLMVGISGYWMQRYVFKKDFYTVSTWVKTLKPSPEPTFSFDTALTTIKKQYPNFTPYVIYFAQNTKGKTAVYGSNSTNSFIHSKKLADVISLDSSGTVAKTRFVNENTSSDYYDIVNSQLHMGRYGGWLIKLLYGLLGITSALLSITGFSLWLKKKKRNSN
jgi:uncharacterized iron-regulated membrane protein